MQNEKPTIVEFGKSITIISDLGSSDGVVDFRGSTPRIGRFTMPKRGARLQCQINVNNVAGKQKRRHIILTTERNFLWNGFARIVTTASIVNFADTRS